MGLFKTGSKKKFGEILIEKGLATKEDIDSALQIQKDTQKKIGMILHEKGIIDMEDIENVLEEQKRAEGFLLKGLIYSIFHSKQPK